MSSAARFTIDNWMVGWNPVGDRWNRGHESGLVHVGSWPDETGWSDAFAFTTGCCELDRGRNFTLAQKVMMLFIDFHTLTVRDGIDPQAAHREFLKVDQYRRRISPDVPGAE